MPKVIFATIIGMGLAVVMVCPAEEWKTSKRKQPTKCTAVSEKLGGLHEELAAYRLRIIHEQLVEMSEKYPETSGGKEANEMLEKAGLKNPEISVLGNYGIRPKNSFASGVPAFHNSYRP